MTFPLLGPKLKIERAYHHLVQLEVAERQFFEQNVPSLVIEDDPETGGKLGKIQLNQPLPEIIHVVAGEQIYQLRSALDQIAVACARMSSAQPNPKDIHYPCGDSLAGFEASCRKNLADFDRDLADKIVGTNAYDGGDDVLRAVFRMGNVDKHLELIAAGAAGRIAGLSDIIVFNGGLVLSGNLTPLEEGIVISKLAPDGQIFLPDNTQAHVKVDGQILLRNAGPYEGKPLIPFLGGMSNKVRDVYNAMAALCAQTGRT